MNLNEKWLFKLTKVNASVSINDITNKRGNVPSRLTFGSYWMFVISVSYTHLDVYKRQLKVSKVHDMVTPLSQTYFIKFKEDQ